MVPLKPRAYGFHLLLFLGVGICVAWGGTASFTFPGKNESKTVGVTTVEVNRVTYVLLTDLVSKAGGDCRVDREQIEVNLGGGTALVSRGDTEVNASYGRFSLRHPLLVNGNTVRMALSDVIPFFNNGFRISVTQGAGESPPETQESEPETPPASIPDAEAQPAPDESKASSLRLVVIDPGHGGKDAGAVGAAGLKEKDVALSVAKRLRDALRDAHGVQTLLTREDDVAVPVEKRTSLANVKRGSLLVSIHAGAGLAPSMMGVHVLYGGEAQAKGAAPNAASLLADAVASSVSAATSMPVRGVHAAACRVFVGLRMPAIQVEAGVLTTPGEETLLADGGYQQKIAEGIAKGIMQYAGGGR